MDRIIPALAFAVATAFANAAEPAPLWDARVALPNAAELPLLAGVEFHVKDRRA